jgi:hypothetical protein
VFTSGFEEAEGPQLSSSHDDLAQHRWEAGSDSDLSDSDADCEPVNVDQVAANDSQSITVSILPTDRTRRIVHIHDTA